MFSSSSEAALERAAANLLGLAAAGASPREIGTALEPLLPLVDKIVEQRHRSWECKLGSQLDDLRQDVKMKLLLSPPDAVEPTEVPLVRFMAWVRRVTSNLLVDRYRKWKVRTGAGVVSVEGRTHDREGDREAGAPDGAQQLKICGSTSYGRPPEDVVAARDERERLLRHLEGRAPAVHRLLELILEMPGATDLELAEELGVSLNVVHKNRQRLREHLVRFREAGALGE